MFFIIFITSLLGTVIYVGTYNKFLMIVDKFSKICQYILCHLDMTAGKLAKIII